jgi:hypothetical protein
METKVCTKCHQELPITDFNYRNKAKGTRRSECKYCHTKYMRDKYQEKKVIVQQWKTELCCAKCGESRGYVLDYHHIDPSQKEDTIARMISNNYTLDKVKQEIEKCICLCANCHREFHYLEEKDGITIDSYLQK